MLPANEGQEEKVNAPEIEQKRSVGNQFNFFLFPINSAAPR